MTRVLVVDDVQEYLSSLSRALAGEYDVVTAASLEEAQERMDDTIKLALVDVRLSEEDMANRDGIIFLGWLRENYPEVPVVMMSAYRDFDSAVDSLNLGASRYLKKPINLRELKDLISSLITNTR
jgi:two-component system nitrogen regulation response regulator GlnG